MNKERDISIDILKCIAAILITWSHFKAPLGEYAFLSTGGAFGDALFFFCSGYTLFLGKELDFFNWYKRRINRIYPTIFVWALLSSIILSSQENMLSIIISGGGWFVSCIMIYYIALWFIRKYALSKLNIILGIVGLLIVVWYFTIGTCSDDNSMYGATYFKWLHYFIYMLSGSIYGLRYKQHGSHGYHAIPSLAIILISIVLFYILFSFYSREGILNAVQLFSLIPLAGVCIGFYRFCNTSFAKKLYFHKVTGFLIKFVGGLCLEIYIVQWPFLTDKLNSLFPLNIIILLVAIIFAAYLLRCVSRMWSQTFKDSDYNWKEVITLF